MIRNLFIFIFAACLGGISLDGRNSAYGHAAYDYLDDYEDDGAFRGLPQTVGPINTNTASSATPKISTSKISTPKISTSKIYIPKASTPKASTPKASTPKASTPKASTPKASTAKASISKISTSTQKVDLTKETTATTPKVPLNNTDSKLKGVAFATTLAYLSYKRGYREYIEYYDFPRLDPNKDTYFLIPGYFEHRNKYYTTEDYQMDFLTSIGPALLYYCDCNIIGVKWKISIEPRRIEVPIRGAILTGRRLGKHIYDLANRKGFKKPISLISHHLGNVAATAVTDIARRPVKYVYALDQIALPAPFRQFYIRQDSSYLVQTLTTRGFKRNYGHRNFYPNGGNYSSYEDQCFYCQSYRLFSENIRNSGNDHQATFCSTYGAYVENLCEYFQEVSYYNRISPEALPYGNYFITEESLNH